MIPEEPVKLKKGDMVTYCPPHGPNRIGIVKSINGNNAFVVYNCNDEWEHFEDYTGAATNISDLKPGWIE